MGAAVANRGERDVYAVTAGPGAGRLVAYGLHPGETAPLGAAEQAVGYLADGTAIEAVPGGG